MKNSKSRKALEALIALVGLVFLSFTYVYGVSAIKAETEQLVNSNRLLQNKSDAYMMLYTNQAKYAKETEEMKAEFVGLEKDFVKAITTTDEIMYVANMVNANVKEQLNVSYLNMGLPNVENYMPPVENNAAFASGAIEMPSVNDDGIALYTYTLDYGFNVTYQGFKDMVHYLSTNGTKKQITAVSLSFDNTTGILNGNISVNELALIGTDGSYNPLVIPHVPLTVENIFGTIVIPEEEAEEE